MVEIDANVNDPVFARRCAEVLLGHMEHGRGWARSGRLPYSLRLFEKWRHALFANGTMGT